MSFINPAMLVWLVPLMALPILIHLLNKRFPRLFMFSSVERLRATLTQQSKLFRFRHWILMALRTCFLGLLLAAFLKPVLPRFGSQAAALGARHVLIVIDHSLSMEYLGNALPPRKRAIAEAQKIIDNLAGGDLVNVMLVEQSPRTCFIELSNNHTEARRFVNGLGQGLSRADFSQANAAAARQDQKRFAFLYLGQFCQILFYYAYIARRVKDSIASDSFLLFF